MRADADLVEYAVRNAGRRARLPMPRWAHVVNVFGVGSTSAHELCRRFGLDPDEDIPRLPIVGESEGA